ncbi:hypothetical protein CAPN005_11850 [Capnocytophaga cynodegmi]|nr:hypothetical protein CAPN005_11850 [Capnocytophaga cynodegmi]
MLKVDFFYFISVFSIPFALVVDFYVFMILNKILSVYFYLSKRLFLNVNSVFDVTQNYFYGDKLIKKTIFVLLKC